MHTQPRMTQTHTTREKHTGPRSPKGLATCIVLGLLRLSQSCSLSLQATMADLPLLLWLSPATPATGNDETSARICKHLAPHFRIRRLNALEVSRPF